MAGTGAGREFDADGVRVRAEGGTGVVVFSSGSRTRELQTGAEVDSGDRAAKAYTEGLGMN